MRGKIFIAMCLYLVSYHSKASVLPPAKPTTVAVNFTLNKIYNINTINETFMVDGYISFSWNDHRLIGKLGGDTKDSTLVVFNESEVMSEMGLWNPVFEFINVIGKRSAANYRYVLRNDGKVEYFERFSGCFTDSMMFSEYPFDEQDFSIELESFGYGEKDLLFETNEVNIKDSEGLLASWVYMEYKDDVVSSNWDNISVNKSGSNSRWILEVKMKRDPGYFYWQFFFPLGLIVVCAWFVFWIKSYGDRLSTSFALLIAVVAFNFFTSTLIPELPYNTFIESCIITGYGVIFITILFTVFDEWLSRTGREDAAEWLNHHLRWIIPLGHILTLLVIIKSYGLDLTLFRISNFLSIF